MKTKKLHLALTAIIGWILSLVVLVPFAIVIINSFKSEAEAYAMNLALPKEWIFKNYSDVFRDGHILRSFLNSLLLSCFTVLIGITVSAMASFILQRHKSKFNQFCYYFFFAGLIAPMNFVTTLRILKIIGLSGTYTGIILLYSAMAIPFAIFLFYGFVSSIPREIDEAAIIDGCGISGLFFNVVLPLLRPVTITAGVLTFMSSWNDFITPLYVLNQSSKWGMILAVYNFWGFYQQQWSKICAVIVLTLLPILVMYIASQKYIIAGMTSGSVKG